MLSIHLYTLNYKFLIVNYKQSNLTNTQTYVVSLISKVLQLFLISCFDKLQIDAICNNHSLHYSPSFSWRVKRDNNNVVHKVTLCDIFSIHD